MPSKTSVMRWLLVEGNEWFREQYAQARDAQADTHVDDMIDIADEARNDFVTRELGDGVEVQVVDHEHISRSKLRIDTRKWIAARMAPKKYGDKLSLGGEGEGGAVTVVIKKFGEAPEGGAAHA